MTHACGPSTTEGLQQDQPGLHSNFCPIKAVYSDILLRSPRGGKEEGRRHDLLEMTFKSVAHEYTQAFPIFGR